MPDKVKDELMELAKYIKNNFEHNKKSGEYTLKEGALPVQDIVSKITSILDNITRIKQSKMVRDIQDGKPKDSSKRNEKVKEALKNLHLADIILTMENKTNVSGLIKKVEMHGGVVSKAKSMDNEFSSGEGSMSRSSSHSSDGDKLLKKEEQYPRRSPRR